ncbi:hypothetical protein WA556_005191 [Blastocystis sp. ATCC 50177/Nand II]
MASPAKSEVLLTLYAECTEPKSLSWTRSIVELTRRYILLLSEDRSRILFKCSIPDILTVARYTMTRDHPYTVRLQCSTKQLLISVNDESNIQVFQTYLEDVMKTSTQVRLRTREMIFNNNNVDQECADTVFADILSKLFECKEPKDLKRLLGRVKDYQNETDISILTLQKPYYLNFVECLRYFDEALVTDELMQYAVSLIDGFDDIIDDPSVGDEMKPTPVNIREMFIGEKTLGRGKYGTVYLGTVRGSPERVALKRINKANMTPQDAKNVMKEAAILYKLRRHPHIVGLRFFWEDPHNYYLVQDYMAGGELFNAIVNARSFSEAQAQKCVLTLLCTLDYCHQRGIVHRDLKPENLLLGEPNNLDSIRIADFGLANELDISNTLKSYCGTPGYIAPEIALNKPYGPAVDMWSLGVIAYILLCGYHPFPQDNDKLMLYNICHGIFNFNGDSWADKSEEAKDFITRLLCVDPAQRLTARQALTHRWMMFESKSTMNMNRAVQELERFNARKVAHAVDVAKAQRIGIQIVNFIAMSDCLIYMNPTTSQDALFSLPRGTVLSADNMVSAPDGVWIHVFDHTGGQETLTNPAGKWALAGRKLDNPVCVPVGKEVYMSKFKRGKAFHLVKKSPSRDEPMKMQVPGGLAMIADRVFSNNEGTWMEINKQTLDQLNVTLEPPLYVCLMLGENVLFNKIYGK